ncbi:MAG TPA: hypothetical protein VM942_06335, partial [Acidimicrobiales bacterium]|nr:hypothetical protein [Acidimicrobiales bacterium]
MSVKTVLPLVANALSGRRAGVGIATNQVPAAHSRLHPTGRSSDNHRDVSLAANLGRTTAMGRASNRKKERREERAIEARKLRIVVCSYPDKSLEPAAELLKAAIVYGDEVLLHSPTAILLASVATLSNLSPADLIPVMRGVAPSLGDAGTAFARQMDELDSTLGSDSAKALMQLLLDPTPGMRDLLATLDGEAANQLEENSHQLREVQQELDRVVEEQLESAGVASVMPAIDAGLLKLAPVDATEDLFDGYIDALWSILRDPRYFPLFDDQIADLVDAAVRVGMLNPSSKMRARGRQAGVATGFLARLPTFPRASMDEIVDIRAELDRPLVRFRAEMVNVADGLGVEAFEPEFDQAAEEAWMSKVHPALLELEELVEEKRLRTQFGAKLPGSGVLGTVGGLITGIITHAPLTGLGV